jgi:hypothetical protein
VTRTVRVFSGLALAVVLLGAGAYLFLRGGSPDALAPKGRRAEASRETVVAPAPADAVVARAAVDAPPPPAPSDGPPASYRAALGAFTGRLLEPDLTPAKGLKVAAVEFEFSRFLLDASVLLDEKHAPPPIESASGLSDDEGRFTLQGLEPRALQLLGIDLGGPRATFRVVDRSPVSGETVDLGDIVLEPFVTFVGRVVNEEREPVAGARVRATNLPALIFQFGIEDIRRGCAILADVLGSPKVFEVPPIVWQYETLLPIPTALSDDEGKFKLQGIPLGMVSIVADRPGSKAGVKAQPSGKAGQRNVGDVMLTPGFTLGGTVVDGARKPVADVEVLAGVRNPALPVPAALMQPAGRTDARGEFRLTGLPNGSDAYVATRTSRGQPWRVHGPMAAAESGLVVQLAPPSGFVVTLRDEAGKPVADAELFIAADPLEGGVPLPPIFAPPMQKLTEVKDDGIGVKRVTGLDAGKYQVIGRAPGFALATANVSAADPAPPCELVFVGANAVDVTVVRAKDKQPLDWAFASLAPKGIFERPVARARSDREGRLRLDRVPAGDYVLSVHHPAQATFDLEVTVPTAPLTVELRFGGNLKGKLLDHGNPPNRSLFLVLIALDAERDAQRGAPRPDAVVPTFTASAETGDFAAPNLSVGDYRFEVRDRIVGKGPLALFQTMRDDPLAKGEFSIREGETTELVVDVAAGDGPTAELYGSVWMNGAPAADVSIRFEGPKNRTVKSDDAGNYRFDALPAAKGRVLVQGLKDGDLFSLGNVVHREEVELRPGESRRLDINLEVAAVRGRVTGPGPLPAGLGTMVILRDAAGGANQFSMTNPLTGGYEFAHVPAGKFDLLVRQKGAAPYSTTIEVEPRRGDVELDIALQFAISIRGRVVLPEGAAAAANDDDRTGSTLFLVDAEGRPAGRGRVDGRKLTYVFEEATPGEFGVRWFRQGQTLLVRKVEIPAGGANDLTLPFELPAPGEVIPPLFPNLPAGARRLELGAH